MKTFINNFIKKEFRLFLTLVILFIIPPASGEEAFVSNKNFNTAELTYETPEKMLVKSLVEISEGKVDVALKTIDTLIKQTPNFKLAYLIQGDLLLAHANKLMAWVTSQKVKKRRN